MNIFKRRISLILSVVMLATAILPIVVVNAATTVEHSLTLAGKSISFDKTYEVEGGEKIVFNASIAGGSVATIGYKLGNNAETRYSNNNKITLTVPQGTVGSYDRIYLTAAGTDADGNVVQMGWKNFMIKYQVNGDDHG